MSNGSTPLLLAADFGRLDVVQLLLQADANIHHALKDRSTALTLAAKRGHADVVRCLREASKAEALAGYPVPHVLWGTPQAA